ncbi:MAG: hypothetical protein ACAI25_03285, partial [Planctomycetota bacterium]
LPGQGWCQVFDLTADGKLGVFLRNQGLELWDLDAGVALDRVELGPRGDNAWCVDVSADGRTVAAGTRRGVVLVFDVVGR